MDYEPRVHSRGYLPHLDSRGTTQFVTWRCADAVKEGRVLQIFRETSHFVPAIQRRERAKLIEAESDLCLGSCPLHSERSGEIMKDVLLENHGSMYDLIAWVIMPNHVHVVLTPLASYSLSNVMKQIKGKSARLINLNEGREGRLWQPESFDKWVRDDRQLAGVVGYVHDNPRKAGLVALASDWGLSSIGNFETLVREQQALDIFDGVEIMADEFEE